MSVTTLRVRRSLESIQDDYVKGNKKPLEDLMRAWKGIKELPPDHPDSFFMIGGYHGEPFRGAGWGNSSYWGGYCNHGNVLFPTWHRVYLLRLEDALRSIPGCQDVTLPFWDETSDDSVANGIPWALTQRDFVLDGQTIPNPLRSFVLNKGITDNIQGDNPNYSKPKGYETVRYPLSGLVGTPDDIAQTKAHNAKFPDDAENVKLLNQNIVNWLGSHIVVNGQNIPTNVKAKYVNCLKAPNYTVFSNTTSAAQWNEDLDGAPGRVTPLESPHNSMHLAVGGYDVPAWPNAGDFSPIDGANGDMGENDTAGLDPIFYFHHCFVDRIFWLWQKRNGFTGHLEVIEGYPGTNSVDSQGPTPGVTPNSWLGLDSPLDPFKLGQGAARRPYTSRDCIHIEKQLGYTYGPGSLDAEAAPAARMEMAVAAPAPGHTLRITGLNRAPIRGSFLVMAYATVGGQRQVVGTEAVLSRWSVRSCANCQTHLEVKAHFDLSGLGEDELKSVEVEVRTRDGVIGRAAERTSLLPVFSKKPFRFEVR